MCETVLLYCGSARTISGEEYEYLRKEIAKGARIVGSTPTSPEDHENNCLTSKASKVYIPFHVALEIVKLAHTPNFQSMLRRIPHVARIVFDGAVVALVQVELDAGGRIVFNPL